MKNEILTIIKEFEYEVKDYPYLVKAKILQNKSRSSDKMYYGRLSHYCKPSEFAASAYRPSSFNGFNLKAVEKDLLAYLKGFTSYGIEVNEEFDRLIY